MSSTMVYGWKKKFLLLPFFEVMRDKKKLLTSCGNWELLEKYVEKIGFYPKQMPYKSHHKSLIVMSLPQHTNRKFSQLETVEKATRIIEN